jgi:hypothetical protein
MLKYFFKNGGGRVKLWRARNWALLSGNYHEFGDQYVVMEMVSICLKIRHVNFGDTSLTERSIGAIPLLTSSA